MHGYSDRINHAFAFAAKHYGTREPERLRASSMAHPGNVAVILSRYEADESTIVAGICHCILEEALPQRVEELERKVSQKFGSVVLAIARDALEPKYDERGSERPWRVWKQDFLCDLAAAEPRALDVCVADEIQICGSTIAALNRLGTEYVYTVSRASADQWMWWYRSMLEVLESRADWPRREMLDELRRMSALLVTSLRRAE